MPEGKTNFRKSVFSISGLLLLLVALVLLNLIVSKINLRWDVTENHIYSLSEGTNKILDNLNQDVVIKVFFTKNSPNLPVSIKNYTGRLLDLLAEYEYQSNRKVIIEVYDTVADSEEEEWAQKYGIEGIDLPTGERIYLGLVATAADQEEAITLLDPTGEKHIEYDITRIISRVQNPEKLKIGVISGFPVFGGAPTSFRPAGGEVPWLFISELQKTYDVYQINPFAPNADIAPKTDLLLLVFPKDLPDGLQYAIDQYVLRGGNVIAYVDPYAVMDMNQGMVKAASPGRLLSAWGVRMDTTKVLADFSSATKLRNETNQVEDNPFWLSLRSNTLSDTELITAGLESMLLPVVGVFEKLPGSTVEYIPLLQSSTNAMITDAMNARFGVDSLRRDFSPADRLFDLAVRISGRFDSAFPEGKPSSSKKEEKPNPEAGDKATPEHLARATEKATIIIVADADNLFDGYYVNRQNFLGFEIANIFNDNLNFLLNACEVLSGGEDLISVRTRGIYERPFDRVKALEAKAQAKWLNQEQELIRKADEANQKLRELEQQKGASKGLLMSEEQEIEIRKFQDEKLRINKELKQVRRKLRSEIVSLGTWVKFFNLFFIPLLVAVCGIAYALYKRKKETAS